MRYLICFFLTLLGLGEASATHVIGLNVSYKHLSGDSFEVYCDMPSNCPGTFFNNGNCSWNGPLPTYTSFYLYCEDQGFLDTITAFMDTIIDASPVCKSDPIYNACSYGPCGYMGIKLLGYKAIIDFSIIDTGNCHEWMMVYRNGARSSGHNFVGQPFNTVWSSLNKSDYPENSSVQFKNPRPIPFYCAGQEVTYHWGATDADGDSLFWELDTAWDEFNAGSFTSINYASGFAPTQPLPGAITLNSANGDISFTPFLPAGYIVGIYAVAVKVSEYDKSTGALKAQLHRDVHFMVVDSCDNSAPIAISTLNSNATIVDSISIQTCQGQDIEIDIVFADYDTSGALSGDSLSFQCNLGEYVDSVAYSHSGTNPDTFHISIFNFTSATAETWFNVFVEDDFCPNPGYNDYSFRILSGRQTYLRSDTTVCADDTIILNAHGGDTFYWQSLSGDPIQVGTNFGCVGCQKPWIHPSQSTIYTVESDQPEGCGNKDTVTIHVFEAYPIDLTIAHGGSVLPTVYCANDDIDTILTSTGGGVFSGPGILNSLAGVFSPFQLNVPDGADSVINVIYDLTGSCANSDSIKIRVKGLPNTNILSSDTFFDHITAVQLTAATNGGAWSDYANSGNPTAQGIFNPSLFIGPDSVLIFYQADDSGCLSRDSMLIRILHDSTLNILSDQNPSLVSIIPNPTSGMTRFSLGSGQKQRMNIAVYDQHGRIVFETRLEGQYIDFDSSHFQVGVYTVRFELNQTLVQIEKMVIIR